MTPQTILLTLHLLGAFIVGINIVQAIIALTAKQEEKYTRYARLIGMLGGVELLTGAGLQLYTHAPQLAFCSKIGVYIAVMAATEYALYRVITNSRQVYPRAAALTLPLIGFASCLLVII